MLTRQQMVDAVVRMLMATDAGIKSAEDLMAARQMVEGLDDSTLAQIAGRLQGDRTNARMYSDEPEASVPPPPPIPAAPPPRPDGILPGPLTQPKPPIPEDMFYDRPLEAQRIQD